MEVTGAQFIGIGHLDPRPDWRMAAHLHPFHEMIAVVAGRMRLAIRGTKIVAEAGDVLFYRAGAAHEEVSDPAAPVESLFISFHWDPGADEPPVVTVDADGRIRRLMEWLYAERTAVSPGARQARAAFFRSVLAEWTRLNSRREHDAFEPVRAYVRERIAEPLALDDLARRAGMSKYHFLRRYRAVVGRTPMEDVRILRLEYARDLILTTGLPLKTVAPRAGLGDEYHMSRLFRKYLKTTPGALRKEVGGAR